MVFKILFLQGLSTEVLQAGCTLPPPPQNTFAVIENLK